MRPTERHGRTMAQPLPWRDPKGGARRQRAITARCPGAEGDSANFHNGWEADLGTRGVRRGRASILDDGQPDDVIAMKKVVSDE